MKHEQLDHLRDDLRYVRTALARYEEEPMPIFSRILWSGYCLIGFVLLDFMPPLGSSFLLIGGLVCVGLEALHTFFNRKSEIQTRGHQDFRDLAQLIALAAAGVVIYVLGLQGRFSMGYSIGQMYLVLVGYHFLSAGIWSSMSFSWNGAVFLGLAMLVGAVFICFIPHGVWTGLGLLLALIIGLGMHLPFGFQKTASNDQSS